MSSFVTLPLISALPFVTTILASSGTAASNVATKVDADVAFNSVIFPRVAGAAVGSALGSAVGSVLGAAVGSTVGSAVGTSVAVSLTVTATVAL